MLFLEQLSRGLIVLGRQQVGLVGLAKDGSNHRGLFRKLTTPVAGRRLGIAGGRSIGVEPELRVFLLVTQGGGSATRHCVLHVLYPGMLTLFAIV